MQIVLIIAILEKSDLAADVSRGKTSKLSSLELKGGGEPHHDDKP